jgi:glycosyltransferase involved in cell wall biosynthesis
VTRACPAAARWDHRDLPPATADLSRWTNLKRIGELSDNGDRYPGATPPNVSVVIPTRNRRRFLIRALESVLVQLDVTVEVVVVDDASTDDTAEWLARATDPRVRVITYESPQGVSAARNDAIGAATAEWVAFLDDDDFWAPTYLSQQLAHAARTAAVAVAASALMVDERLNVLFTLRAAVDEPHLGRALFRNNVIGGPSRVMVKTQALRDLNGFDQRLAIVADWDLWIALVREAVPALNLEPLVAITQHDRNMQLMEVDRIVWELDYLREKHARYAASIGAVFGGPELYRWLARQYRRAGRNHQAATTYLMIARRYRVPHDLFRAIAALAGRKGASRRSRVGGGNAPHWVLTSGSMAAGREPTPQPGRVSS